MSFSMLTVCLQVGAITLSTLAGALRTVYDYHPIGHWTWDCTPWHPSDSISVPSIDDVPQTMVTNLQQLRHGRTPKVSFKDHKLGTLRPIRMYLSNDVMIQEPNVHMAWYYFFGRSRGHSHAHSLLILPSPECSSRRASYLILTTKWSENCSIRDFLPIRTLGKIIRPCFWRGSRINLVYRMFIQSNPIQQSIMWLQWVSRTISDDGNARICWDPDVRDRLAIRTTCKILTVLPYPNMLLACPPFHTR